MQGGRVLAWIVFLYLSGTFLDKTIRRIFKLQPNEVSSLLLFLLGGIGFFPFFILTQFFFSFTSQLAMHVSESQSVFSTVFLTFLDSVEIFILIIPLSLCWIQPISLLKISKTRPSKILIGAFLLLIVSLAIFYITMLSLLLISPCDITGKICL